MRVRLAFLDFDAGSARLAVEASPHPGSTARLRDMVDVLVARGVSDIDVRIDSDLPDATATALRATLADTCARVSTGRWADPVERRGNRAFERPGAAQPGRVFEVLFESVESALDRSAMVVALVRLAAGVDPVLGGRVRFAVHELVANAADHADFHDHPPRIEVAVVITPSTALVSYRDNAGVFVTTAPREVDVDLKIARGERRGLGLYMLNRMARQLRYRRNGDWNETSVLFVESRSDATEPKGGSVMEGLKLEQTPYPLPNTVILKPIGSIDSTTVNLIDAKLTALMSQKNLRIVIDMSAVEFVSSAGVGVFLGSVSQLRANGGDLVFMAMPATVLEVFEIINLSSYFKIVGSAAELQPVTQG